MNIERLSVSLRPRNAWEAIDLGLRMAMSCAKPLYAAWLAVTLPVVVFVMATVGLGLGQPAWALFIVWWLKPMFDRVALHIVSHAVFGNTPTVCATISAWPQWLLRSRLLRALTWGRFDMRRSLRLPVDQLEGLRANVRQRRALISRKVSGAARWLTFTWINLEMLFMLGALGLCMLIVPNEMKEAIDWSQVFRPGAMSSWLGWSICGLQLTASLLLEPLYVAAGFMLYLKRRSDLEAWDVELQFRRIADSQNTSASVAHALTLLAAVFVMSMACMPPARAETAPLVREQAIAQAPQALKRVMNDSDFGRSETIYTLRWRSDPDEDKSPRDWGWLETWLQWIAHIADVIGTWLASIGRVLGMVLLACIVLALLYVVLRQTQAWRRHAKNIAPLAELAGFDIRPQSLPSDIAGAAMNLLQTGQPREAMSLLFRGALSVLAHRDRVPFSRGDTEGDCLDRVFKHVPHSASFFARMMGCWQMLAYAHREVVASEIEALCREWPRNFARHA
ncbi:MAG TPA: DUF4129 domain-containing protein [Rhodocyclaceae bacterium]|nr:DUF4129 domain-containing protein [Rhodocyclaceae bacterium]